MKRRLIVIILIILTFVFATLFYLDEVSKIMERFTLSGLVGLAAIASGVSAVIMSISSIRTSQFEAIREYFFKGDSPEMTRNRKKMYQYEAGEVDFDERAASFLCSHYHFWGMMVDKGHLPIWVFESASGPSIVRLYAIMEDFIMKKRKVNPNYAYHFETMVKKIRRKYAYEYELKEIVDVHKKEDMHS